MNEACHMDNLNKMSLKRDSFGEPGNSTDHFWAAVGRREAVFREHGDGLEKECEHHAQPCSQAPAHWTESKKGEGSFFYLGQSLDLEALSYFPQCRAPPCFRSVFHRSAMWKILEHIAVKVMDGSPVRNEVGDGKKSASAPSFMRVCVHRRRRR